MFDQPFKVSQVIFNPSNWMYLLLQFGDDTEVCVWSKPPKGCMASSSASSPACPKAVWPRSCANDRVSVSSSSSPIHAQSTARLPKNGSGACGNSRRHGQRKPAFYALAAEMRRNAKCGRGAIRRAGFSPAHYAVAARGVGMASIGRVINGMVRAYYLGRFEA